MKNLCNLWIYGDEESTVCVGNYDEIMDQIRECSYDEFMDFVVLGENDERLKFSVRRDSIVAVESVEDEADSSGEPKSIEEAVEIWST